MAIHFQEFGSMYPVAQVGRPISRGIVHSTRTLELSTIQLDQGLFPLPFVSLDPWHCSWWTRARALESKHPNFDGAFFAAKHTNLCLVLSCWSHLTTILWLMTCQYPWRS